MKREGRTGGGTEEGEIWGERDREEGCQKQEEAGRERWEGGRGGEGGGKGGGDKRIGSGGGGERKHGGKLSNWGIPPCFWVVWRYRENIKHARGTCPRLPQIA